MKIFTNKKDDSFISRLFCGLYLPYFFYTTDLLLVE